MSTPIKNNTAGLEDILQIIQELPEGGSPVPEGDFSDPDYVYAVTRPKDWLPMPTPGDDEMYLLNLIPEGLDGAFSAIINFNGNCTVDFGNIVNGAFTVKESLSPSSGVRFYHTIQYDDYGDDTSDGYRQYLVRIKGGFTQALLYYSTADIYSYGVPFLVDAIIGKSADVRFGESTIVWASCDKLQYVRFVGAGGLTNLAGFNFRACQGLLSVSAEKDMSHDYMNYMFERCRNLVAVSEKLFANNVSYKYVFRESGLKTLPKTKFSPKDVTSMFSAAIGIIVVDGRYFDTSMCTVFDTCFNNCSVRHVINLDISSATSMIDVFIYTPIVELTFAGDSTPGGYLIEVQTGKMSHKALVNMINSLPTALSPATITITGNPGAADLTEEEIAVATAKNWTVTI